MAQHTPTPEELAAAKADFDAKTAANEAEAKYIASQKALDQARAAADPGVAQLAAATQAANIAAQEKAASDSRAAMLKNSFAVPDSGYAGEIKAGDKAGGVEAALLSARALNIAATTIVTRMGTVKDRRILLHGGSDLPDFQALIAFDAQTQMVGSTLEAAVKSLDSAMAAAQPVLGIRRSIVSPAAIGAGLDAANKLLGYFRTDYSIQGVAVTPDDLVLVNALADALSRGGAKVQLPALYNATALLGPSKIFERLQTLAMGRTALQQKIDLVAAAMHTLTTAAAAEKTDTDKKQRELDALAELKTASDQANATVALYDALVTKLTTPDDKSKVPLAAIVQQQAIREALANGAQLMTAKISTAGGTYYTRKNIGSFLGMMPFFVMGGVVVSYSVFDGKEGFVVSAGAIPVDGGFFKVGELPRLLTDGAT